MPKAKKQSADILLGEGSFGCVVQPKLACPVSEKSFPSSMKKVAVKKQVSKIFTNVSDFEMEMKKSALAAKVDPSGTKMLLPTSSCVTDKKFVQKRSSAIQQCDAMMESLFQNSKKLYQMNMPYGGQRVDKYLKQENVNQKKTRREFLADLMPVLEGLVQLAEHKVCHQDIKPSNMLYTPTGPIILIDYSLMVPFEEVYLEGNLRVLKHSYLPYPPEYKLFSMFYKKVCIEKMPCPYYQEVYETLTSFGGDRYEAYLQFHDEADIQKNLKTLYKWTAKFTTAKELQDAYRPFVDRVDPYSVGMCMIMVDKYLKDADTADAAFDKKYKHFVRNLTHIHPQKRWNGEKAWKEAQKLLKRK